MTRVTFLLLSILMTLNIKAQIKSYIDQPYIESIGKSDTLIIPDRIYISIVLSEDDSKGKFSLEALELRMQMALKQANINIEKDLSLNGIQSNFSKSFLRGTDIRKKKEFTLLVREANIASQVLISLERHGISNASISGVRYSKSDQIGTELRIRALKKAKRRAELMAEAIGQKIGSALLVTEQTPSLWTPNNTAYDNSLYGYASTRSSNIDIGNIEFNKIRFTQSVFVTFKLL